MTQINRDHGLVSADYDGSEILSAAKITPSGPPEPPLGEKLEKFIKNRWRLIALVGALLFALFVWPTLYKFIPNGHYPMRQNRITGEIQRWNGDWR